MEQQTSTGTNQDHQPAPARTKSKHAGIQQRHQAAALQRFAFDSVLALRAACTDKQTGTLTITPQTATAIYRLIGSWDTARDAVRILRGKGLPQAVRSKT